MWLEDLHAALRDPLACTPDFGRMVGGVLGGGGGAGRGGAGRGGAGRAGAGRGGAGRGGCVCWEGGWRVCVKEPHIA